MRIAAISDSHGDKNALIRAVKHMAGVDVIFHLGDYSKDIEHIRSFYSGQLYVVSGNCDCFLNTGVPSELSMEIGDKSFFVTHGHKFRVKYGLNTLYYKGLELGADIVLFGHTHSSQVVMVGDMVILNPGSVSKPKNTQRPTYGIIEILNGNIKPEIIEF